jgi:hypothetical protein
MGAVIDIKARLFIGEKWNFHPRDYSFNWYPLSLLTVILTQNGLYHRSNSGIGQDV